MITEKDIHIKSFYFDEESVIEANKCSMLVPSDTTLASIDYELNGIDEYIDLMVYGEVRLYYDECCYRRRKDFPNELVEILENNPNDHIGENGFDILNNNWVSCSYTINGELQHDDFVCDGEFGETEDEVKQWLLDVIIEIRNEE